MSLTQAEVDLTNQSLGKIGAKQITLAVQTATEGVQANLHFAPTRDGLLRSFDWSFAKKRLALVSDWVTATVYTTDQYVWTNSLLYKCAIAHTSGTFATDLAAVDWVLVSTYPTSGYDYQYDLPADCLRLLEINDDEIDSVLESNDILCDETDVDIVYIRQVTTTTEWDSLFKKCFILSLAIELLPPLTGIGSGAMAFLERLEVKLERLTARTKSIAKHETRKQGSSEWNDARL